MTTSRFKVAFPYMSGQSAVLLSMANTASSGPGLTLSVNNKGVTVKMGKRVICRNAKPATLEDEYERGMAALKKKLGMSEE